VAQGIEDGIDAENPKVAGEKNKIVVARKLTLANFRRGPVTRLWTPLD